MLACFSMGKPAPADDETLLNVMQGLLQSTTTGSDYRPCVLMRKISDLRPDVHDVIQRLLDSDRSSRDIHRAFQRAGYTISRESISEHRSGVCTCGGSK